MLSTLLAKNLNITLLFRPHTGLLSHIHFHAAFFLALEPDFMNDATT